MQELLDKVDRCIYFTDTVNKVEKNTKAQILKLQEHNEALAEDVKDLNTALEYYKQGVDIVYQKTIKSLEEQLTELMQEVFSGCKYGINFEIEDLRGTKNLIVELFDEKFKGDPDDLGGSLRTVVGYLFHLMYLIKSGRPRILLMDEMFRDVNVYYMDNLISLINRITKATNSVNILVTHVEDIEPLVSKVYEVSNGNFVCTKENYEENNY